MKPVKILFLSGLLTWLCFPLLSQGELINNEIKIERYKTIPLRDGTKLFADVYLPAKPGKYPTIVIRLSLIHI